MSFLLLKCRALEPGHEVQGWQYIMMIIYLHYGVSWPQQNHKFESLFGGKEKKTRITFSNNYIVYSITVEQKGLRFIQKKCSLYKP